MSTVCSRQVEVNAGKGEQLTLGDLRALIRTMEQAGAADSTPLNGRTGWRGQLLGVSARVARFGDGKEAGR